MFTGLIDHTGIIKQINQLDTGIRLQIESQFCDLNEGESIAVDGACLTAIDITQGTFAVELSSETLNLTIANEYHIGQRINLERALKLSDRLGGHFVSGHVDQTALVKDIKHQDDFTHLIIAGIKPKNHAYLIPKGSLCINGASLTLNNISQDECHFMLIPHTLERTNLSSLTINSLVNLEFDLLAKIVAKQTQGQTHEQSI